MFLASITKNEISHLFNNCTIETHKSKPYCFTFITKGTYDCIKTKENKIIINNNIKLPRFTDKTDGNNICSFDAGTKTISVHHNPVFGRPIFYYSSSEEFIISDSIRMMKNAGIKLKENHAVLPEFFVYRIVMPPQTLFLNIYHMKMYGKLIIKIKNDKIFFHEMDIKFPRENPELNNLDLSSNEIISILDDFFKELNPYKNKISTILSGGIDSSILSKFCKEKFNLQNSYSTGYPFEKNNLNYEKKYAFSAAEELGLTHHYYNFSEEEYLKNLIHGISVSELPLHHLQSICLYSMYKNGIPKNKNIIIEGWGAAGVIGNFRNYLFYMNKILFKKWSNTFINKFRLIPAKFSKKYNYIFQMIEKSTLPLDNPQHPIYSFHDYGSKSWTCNYFKTNEQNIINNQYEVMKKFSNLSLYDITSRYSLYGDETITLSIISKLGEDSGKINIFPFYDLKLLSYLFSISWKMKLKKPENILRKKIAEKYGIPKSIIQRKKRGFGIHNDRWSHKDGVFEPLVPLAKKIIDEEKIRKVQSSNPKMAMTYWNILNYSIWKRLFINNEPIEVLLEELEINL